MPAVNVKEREKAFEIEEIEVAAPGLSKKDFKITAENGCSLFLLKKKKKKSKRKMVIPEESLATVSFSRSFFCDD